MNVRLPVLALLCWLAFPDLAAGQGRTDAAQLSRTLHQTYQGWRNSMVRKDAKSWQRYTARPRRVNVKNRILSERRRFPQSVFALPAAPPSLANLKALRMRVKGPTAKATYFGKVDFGVGGEPTENLYVIDFQKEGKAWRYNGAEFVNLNHIPKVRKALKAGDLKFLDHADFKPDGILERAGTELKRAVPWIAKAYVYCPGREVQLKVNRVSDHLFQNTKRADTVIGGARSGANEVTWTIRDIEGGDPKAPITVRVYLMSEIRGQQPIKAFEYQITDGSKPKERNTVQFKVTPEMTSLLR